MALTERTAATVSLGALLALAGCGTLADDATAGAVAQDPRTGFTDGPGIEVCYSGTRVVAPSRARGGALSICVSPGTVERSCESDLTCAQGERCVCGRCVTRPCRNATECEQREACQGGRCAPICTSDSDCGANERCNTGACARRCVSHADCAYGERCSALDGTCIVKLCGESVACGGDEPCVEQERVAELREPHELSWKGSELAYVELREQQGGSTACAIHRIRIVSARHWEIDPVDPVLAPGAGDSGCLGAPSLVEADGRLVLYAARGDGSGLVRATSVDGVSFDREPGVFWGASRAWEQGWVGSPGAVRFGGATQLMYTAGRGAGIGLVQVDEATGAVTLPVDHAIVVPSDLEDPPFWRQMQRVAAPFPVVRDGVVLMYFAGRGVEGSDAEVLTGGSYPADVNDSIGLMSSRDMVTWQRFPTGPILARKTNLRTYLGELEPSVAFRGGSSRLVYVGADATGLATTGLGLATGGQ